MNGGKAMNKLTAANQSGQATRQNALRIKKLLKTVIRKLSRCFSITNTHNAKIIPLGKKSKKENNNN